MLTPVYPCCHHCRCAVRVGHDTPCPYPTCYAQVPDIREVEGQTRLGGDT